MYMSHMEMEILIGGSIEMEILVSSINTSHIQMEILIGGSTEMEILIGGSIEMEILFSSTYTRSHLQLMRQGAQWIGLGRGGFYKR